jgi:hypothetical protein
MGPVTYRPWIAPQRFTFCAVTTRAAWRYSPRSAAPLFNRFSQPCEFGRCPMRASYSQAKPALFFCPHAGAGFGNDSTHYPNPCCRHHDRAVTCFWLANLHDGKRGTGQISQGDASLYAPTLLERRCGRARAFATTCTLGSARAGATTQNRYQRRQRRCAMPIFAM